MTDIGMPPRIEAPSAGQRIALIDVARGIAIVAMVIYHLTWDLSLAGLVGIDPVNDPAWRWFARLIAGTFLGLVGVSLVLSARRGIHWPAFIRRLGVLVAAALAVTAVTVVLTYWRILPAPAYFGILHAIALFSLVAVPFLRLPAILVALAAAFCFAAPFFLTLPVFDAPILSWLGLSPNPPAAVDYVPFFPWFGATLAGIVVARLALAWKPDAFWGAWRGENPVARALAVAGRWSLVIYLVHQPLLFALTSVASMALAPSFETLLTEQVETCERTCAANGESEASCARYCGCVFDELRAANALERAVLNQMTEADQVAFGGILRTCQAPLAPLPYAEETLGRPSSPLPPLDFSALPPIP